MATRGGRSAPARRGRGGRGAFRGRGARHGRDERFATREPQVETRKDDFYEAEENELDEEKHAYRYDRVDNYEYELPSDFEDEEIDEDEAFNEEDEARYGHIFREGNDEGAPPDGSDGSESSGSDADILLSSEGEEDEERDEDEEGPLNKVLPDEDQRQMDRFFRSRASELEDEGWSSLEEASEEESASEAEEEEATSPSAHRALLAAVGAQPRRRAPAYRTEAVAESEQALRPSAALTPGDLLAGLAGESAPAAAPATRRAVSKLASAEGAVAPPLPGPVRERAERQAAYQHASKDAKKWAPLVRALREAPTIKFAASDAPGSGAPTTAALAAGHAPRAGMEAEVAALLAEAGVSSAAAATASEEHLAAKKLGARELEERRQRLAQMRALLFYHESKAKRLKKIKSKEYRKQLRRAAQRALEKREAAGAEGFADESAAREALEAAEQQRALERMTQRHRNSSRWAQRVIQRHGRGEGGDERQALADQLQLGQEIRKKAERLRAERGDGSDSDAEGSRSETSASDDDPDERGRRRVRRAAEEILDGEGDDRHEASASKGLLGLPFMKRARERRAAEARAAAEDALGELEDANDALDGEQPSGRLAFGGRQAAAAAAEASSESGQESGDDAEDGEGRSKRLRRVLKAHAERRAREAGEASSAEPVEPEQEAAPLQPLAGLRARSTAHSSDGFVEGTGAAPGIKVAVAGQPSGGRGDQLASSSSPPPPAFVACKTFAGARAGYAFKKGPKGVGYYQEGRSKAAPVERELEGKKKASPAAPRPSSAPASEPPSASPPSRTLPSAEHLRSADQAALISAAFAGDDVEAQFEKEKAAEVEAELPKDDSPPVLPGWGTWGEPARQPQWAVAAREKARKAREAASEARRDAKLSHVILSEKWDRQAAKLRTAEVPFPFESREAYERSLRQPLGRDFNTDAAFRALTRPAVLKDAGAIIAPMQFSRGLAKEAREVNAAAKGRARAPVAVVVQGRAKRAKKT